MERRPVAGGGAAATAQPHPDFKQGDTTAFGMRDEGIPHQKAAPNQAFNPEMTQGLSNYLAGHTTYLQGTDIAEIKELIDAGANPNTSFTKDHPYYPGMSLTLAVVDAQGWDVLQFLIEKGASPNILIPNSNWDTPNSTLAEWAAQQGNFDLLQAALKGGAHFALDYSVLGDNRHFPKMPLLHNIIRARHLGMLRLFSTKHPETVKQVVAGLPIDERFSLMNQTGPNAYQLPISGELQPIDNAPSMSELSAKLRSSDFIDPIFGGNFSTSQFETNELGEQQSFNREEVLVGLRDFLSSVQNRAVIPGAPHAGTKEFERFYQTIETRLQYIFRCLEDPSINTELKLTALLMLFNGSLACGTARFNETLSAHMLLAQEAIRSGADPLHALGELTHNTQVGNREQLISQMLYHFRRRCFLSAVPDDNVHTYNNYMRKFGQEYGLASPLASYADPTIRPINAEAEKVFRQKFHTFYSPSTIADFIMRAARDITQIGSGVFPALLSEYGPRHLNESDSQALLEFEAKRRQKRTLVLTPREAVRLRAYQRYGTITLQQQQDMKAFEIKEREDQEAREANIGALSREEFERYKQLNAVNEKRAEFQELVLDEEGYPTKAGVHYLLSAMSILKPAKLWDNQLMPPFMNELIVRKRRELQHAEPGSGRQKELMSWLSKL
ncbi:MAG: hypothetical protein JKY15_01450 [Deltaproteobacteria bacterium]|nr:hypothetical protein [Deltaproteobacteria bacterium]